MLRVILCAAAVAFLCVDVVLAKNGRGKGRPPAGAANGQRDADDAAPPATSPRNAAALALPLSTLSLRVSAMQTLHTLDLSAAQLSALRELAQDAADSRSRQAGQGPDALRNSLAALGNILLTGNDSNLDELQDQVDEMLEGDDVRSARRFGIERRRPKRRRESIAASYGSANDRLDRRNRRRHRRAAGRTVRRHGRVADRQRRGFRNRFATKRRTTWHWRWVDWTPRRTQLSPARSSPC